MALYLAPIQGITMRHYRQFHYELFGGIDSYYAPFITTTKERKASRLLFKDILLANNDPRIQLVPQLLSNNGTDFRYFAQHIADMGYNEINWNIGCPYHPVTKKMRGSGLLAYPEIIESFLREVVKNPTYDLSIKMRLGYRSLDEGIAVIKILNKFPLKHIIIHGRTGLQKYEGLANIDAFEVLYKLCNHKVIYNGDIFSKKDYLNIQNRFPDLEDFMLGRGILHDPFLPSIIKGKVVSRKERLEKIQLLHQKLYDQFICQFPKETTAIGIMKEFWLYMSTSMDPKKKHYRQIKCAQTSADYLACVEALFTAYDNNNDSMNEIKDDLRQSF